MIILACSKIKKNKILLLFLREKELKDTMQSKRVAEWINRQNPATCCL